VHCLNRSLLVAAIAALSGCVSQSQYEQALLDNENLQKQRDALALYTGELREQNERLAADVERLGASAADAAWIAEQKARLAELMGKFEEPASIPGVTFRSGNEGIVVEVQGEVLFASGRDAITDDGQVTLRRLVPTISESGRMLRIEGHTDVDPIVNSAWKTNLRLSAARAIAVAEMLIREGVPADRIAIAAYGEYKPRVEGVSDEAKRANRRVEILLIDSR
jgi:chemotaxis protein MotB